MFKKSTLDEIRERTSIVSLIGERIPLKKAGRNHKGLCPFHQEKTPSFSVSDDKGIYHCFGCGAGGDCFEFLMKFDGVSFTEAVEQLAAKAGIAVERDVDPAVQAQEDARARRRKQLLRVNQIAAEFFREALHSSAEGGRSREYLQSRGISGEISKQHFLGFADKCWDSLAAHLAARSVPEQLACELGLIKRRGGGGCYDFFRDRVIFPIMSPRGDVIGFGGRALESSEGGEPQAKYLNSPDSPIYHKSSGVYGLDRSAQAIRSLDQAVVVEGYMDFIALHQCGVENVAAPLGTAITEGHVAQLARYTRNIVLVFDGDQAGSRAALRSLGVFLESGVMPRVALLPEGDDPDTLVRRDGADAFRERIAKARPLFEHFVETTVARTGMDSAGKVGAIHAIAPTLKKVSDGVELSVLRQYVARRLDVDESVVAGSLGTAGKRDGAAPVQGTRVLDQASGGSLERLLVRTMLTFPATAVKAFEIVSPEGFVDPWCRTVAGLMADAMEPGEAPDINGMICGIEDEELVSGLRAMAMDSGRMDEEEAATVVADCARRMATRPLHARLESINEDIVRAQNEGDDERLIGLLAEKNALVGSLHKRTGTGER